jgi:hypothetical protein
MTHDSAQPYHTPAIPSNQPQLQPVNDLFPDLAVP